MKLTKESEPWFRSFGLKLIIGGVILAVVFLLFLFLCSNASADNHYWVSDSPSNSDVGASWQTGDAPTTGDNLFYATNHTGTCTINQAVTFGNITLEYGAGTVVQGAVDFGYSDFSMEGGVWNGVATQWQTCSGNLDALHGTFGTFNVRVVMTGTGKSLVVGANSRFLHSFRNSGSVTLGAWTHFRSRYQTILDVGSNLSIPTGITFECYMVASPVSSFAGAVSGLGQWSIECLGSATLPSFSDVQITCALMRFYGVGLGANATYTLASDLSAASTAISISSDHATRTMTLDLAGYSLTATSITAGTRGIVMSSVAGARIDCPSIVVQTDGHIYGVNVNGIIYSNPTTSINNPNLYSYTATSNLTVKTWSFDSGNASWISVGSTNGTVWGTPPTVTYGHPQYFTVNLKLLDYVNDPFYQNYTITVYSVTLIPPTITSSPILTIESTYPYSYTLTANQTGTWSFTSNATWLSLSINVLSGTDNNNGSYWVKITIINVNGTGYQNYTLNVTAHIIISGFVFTDPVIFGLLFYILCLAISLIGFRYRITLFSVIALVIALIPIVNMTTTFGSYAYILLLFYLPLVFIPIATNHRR
jgi:hypothetical protein